LVVAQWAALMVPRWHKVELAHNPTE
jgi:hypothetical protein